MRETSKPVPDVENTTPRGELELKKFAGSAAGDANASGTPSQLISRLPVPGVVPLFGFNVPRSERNASTAAWIAAALAPAAERTTGAA